MGDYKPTMDGSQGHEDEPIAIVGMSCRLPGGANSPSKLWQMLKNGKSAWSTIPEQRFKLDAFRGAQTEGGSTTYTTGGHFLSQDIASFDASFFAISPLEASAMDPQQRLLLEVAYEAFENAGMSLKRISGSNTGVYVGQWTSDYAELIARDPELPALYHTTGVGPAISSNRISYAFDLRGPSFTVDTGCSASLVALHSAIQSLRTGHTEMSFVGGVNLILDPQRFSYQSKLKMFSVEGRSFAFDERANGYGRGEGCCGVVLKPLSAAVRDGDHVRAVVRNIALNQDGRTPGISFPSCRAQTEAIRAAYQRAGLTMNPDFVEAHGTGTTAGDPVELEAIATAFKGQRQSNLEPLPVGSVKGNVGHTESAAGLAGLVKTVLMLEHQEIPPQVNYRTPSSRLRLKEWNLRVSIAAEKCSLRRISINSFGYGGTNAHLIVDKAESQDLADSPLSVAQRNRPYAFVMSGSDEGAYERSLAALASYVSRQTESTLTDQWMERLAYTVNRRSLQRHRSVLVAHDALELEDLLLNSQANLTEDGTFPENPKITFIFSGQGAQYYNMGRELLVSSDIFAQSIQKANTCLRNLGCEWDLLEELHKDATESRVDIPEFGQPMSTCIQLALVDYFNYVNLRPDNVVGHSSGEIAAAYAAGALSFADAILVSYHRGRLASELLKKGETGAMLAVGLAPELAQDYISRTGCSSKVIVACYNSPSAVTLSGDCSAIDQVALTLDADGVFNRKLRTNGAAYHSEQMRQIEEQYREALKGIKPYPTTRRMVSSVTGQDLGATLLDGDYWTKNLISPVRFAHAVQFVLGDCPTNPHIVIEIGPHSQLRDSIKQISKDLDVRYFSALIRKRTADVSLLQTVGGLYALGLQCDLDIANSISMQSAPPSLIMDLPSYPFDREQKYWHESRLSRDYRHRQFPPHELLGSLCIDNNPLEPRWRQYLSVEALPWLRGHVVQGQIVFPGAGYLSMAVEAARQHALMSDASREIASYSLRNISLSKALIISDRKVGQEISLSLRPEARSARGSWDDWMEFRIFSVADEQNWTEHCRGQVKVTLSSADKSDDLFDQDKLKVQPPRTLRNVPVKRLYSLAAKAGLTWMQPFDNLLSVASSPEYCTAQVRTPHIEEPSKPRGTRDYAMHPGTLDAALFHGLISIGFIERRMTDPVVPTYIKSLTITGDCRHTPDELFDTVSTVHGNEFNVEIARKSGPVLQAEGVVLSRLPGSSTPDLPKELTHRVEWVHDCQSLSQQQLRSLCKIGLPLDGGVAEQNAALDQLTLSYIKEILPKLPTDMSNYPAHRRYWVDWMKAQAQRHTPLANTTTIVDLGVYGEAVKRIAPHLVDVLNDVVELHAVLQDGEQNLLAGMYTETRNQRCFVQVSNFCGMLARQKPGLKVLEIGAGTASATLSILEKTMLNDGHSLISNYDFTDISPGFFDAARTRLAAYSDKVAYRVLDIEQPVEPQGFDTHTYDVVIACNVLHATKKLDDTVEHARSLLRPGGTLILMEITHEHSSAGFIFGGFSGWWAGAAEDGRTSSPLLNVDEWTRKLTDHGFCADIKRFVDYEDEQGGTMSVFLAETPTVVETPSPKALRVLQSPDEVQWVAEVRQQLGDQEWTFTEDVEKTSSSTVVLTPGMCESLVTGVDEVQWTLLRQAIIESPAVLMLTNSFNRSGTHVNAAIMRGLSRTLRLEFPDKRMVNVDYASETLTSAEGARMIASILRSPSFDLTAPPETVEMELRVETDGKVLVPRVFPDKAADELVSNLTKHSKPVQTLFLATERTLKAEFGQPGLLESVRWIDDSSRELSQGMLQPDELIIDMRAASVNFRDVLIASGHIEGIGDLMNDCSGVVTRVGQNMVSRFKVGDRVCCYDGKSYGNHPIVQGDHCAVIPDNVSFEMAASLPIVWGTSYYSLVDVARLQKGETILIHSGAGGVGQSAIALAQHMGAEVFTTAGSPSKREFLATYFGLPEDHIFSNRNTSFRKKIMEATGGKGVDVILNSLTGELFRASCDSLAPYGRLVDIGKKDFLDDALMPTRFLLRNISVTCVDLTLMMTKDLPKLHRILTEVVDLVASNRVKPTTITAWPIAEMETAFRHMAAAKHMGKIVLTADAESKVQALPSSLPLTKLQPDACYVVVGGLGGLGKPVISWLARRGARHILTLSRSGAASKQSQSLTNEMSEMGVSVVAKSCDISSEEQVKAALSDPSLPPIRGVINSAMVLEDCPFESMTSQKWQQALSPKVAGTWNLHKSLPPSCSIDFFISLSSIVSIYGNPSQSNYSAACSFQDAFAEYRTSLGSTAYSLNVGVISDAGFVSENPGVAANLQRRGFSSVTTEQLLAYLDYVISDPTCGSSPAASQGSIGMGLPLSTSFSGSGGDLPVMLRSTRLRYIASMLNQSLDPTAAGGGDEAEEGVGSIARGMSNAKSEAELVELACKAILRQLGRLLALPAERLSAKQSLERYGVDSLVAVELRNWILMNLQADIPILALRETRSIEHLAGLVGEGTRLRGF